MDTKDTQEIIQYIRAARRFDPDVHSSVNFQSSLNSRLGVLNMMPHAYLDELQVRPDEMNVLLSSMLERKYLAQDDTVWNTIRESVIPALVAESGPIRIWCVSCGNGLDAFALGVLLAEALGASEFSERVKIFATDESDSELATARTGIYDRHELVNLDDDTLYRYFSPTGHERFAFRADLRRLIIFGKHRFMEDAPISRMNLVLCRYTLVLQDLERQQKTLSRLLFSLNTGGLLLVGNGEGIPAGQGFQDVDNCSALYRKILRNRLPFGEVAPSTGDGPSRSIMLEETALDICGPAQIVVDAFGVIAFANSKARTTFGITAVDIGKPLQELEISYRPLELRSLIERINRESAPIRIPHVMKISADGPMHFEVLLRPLHDNGRMIGTSIQYADISAQHELSTQVNVLNEQLQAANEELHSAHEELVTTNEELQSTNEELETTNEELQSTNEELETMNEELRSTNNELEATNSAQRQLTQRLEKNNAFLTSIVDSINASIIVLNHSYGVLVWNKRASDLWGLRQDEVIGQNFFGLDIGFPVETLKAPLRNAAATADQVNMELDAISRRGKKVNCKVHANALSPLSPKGFLIMIFESPDGTGK